MTFPTGCTSFGETAGLETGSTCREVFIKGTKSTVATSAATRLESVGLGKAFTGPRQQWQNALWWEAMPCTLAQPQWGCCHMPAAGELWA